MRIEILLVVLCSSLSLARPRESKQLFNWLFGGFGSGTSDDQVSNIGENVRPGVVPSQMLQRRSNQFALEEQTRGLARGRVLNRPPPPSLGGPVKSYRPPPPPGPVRRPLDKVPAPVIISGYASNVVQLGTKEDQRRVQESIEKYEKLNEISDEDVEEKIVPEIVDEEEISTEEVVTEAVREEVKKITEKEAESTTVGVDEAVEADFEAKVETSVELIPKNEEKIEEKTDKTSDNEIVEFEYVDSENPYLPNIPENLDEDIHGAHPEVVKETFQAGYKEIEPVKTNLGDRHDQPAKPQKPLIQKQSAAYPLGKPQRQRPPFKPNKPAAKPQTDGSFLDFLPFFKSSKAKPRRPIGPPPPRPASSHKVTQLEHNPDYPKGLQAPLLLKVDDPQEEVPVRPEVVDKVGLSSRIDNTLHTEHTDNDDDAFVVLPSHDVKPTLVRTQPKRPRIPPPGPSKQFARPPPPRPLKPRLPNEGPLPMLSEPVIGLPQVPASRKQAPFLPKRPLLPPQLPQNFPGAPKNPLNKPPVQLKKPQVPLRKPQFPLNKPPVSLNKPLIKPPGPLKKPQVPLNKPQAPLNKPQAPVNKAPEKVTKKPFDKIFKKPLGAGLSPKVIAKLTSQTKVPDSKKPFDFRPNGASQPTSDITSHLSSLMNYFLRTTPSPIPAPSLPSLVEDTEFADIVHGYKPSDKNQTELGTTEKNTENKTTKLPNLVSTSSTPSSTVKVSKVSDETYDALDSLTAPVVQKPPRNFNNVVKLRNKPRPVPVPQPRPRLPLPPTTAKSYTSFTSPTSSTTSPPTTVRISTTSPPPVPTTTTPRLITTTASSNSVFKSNEGITFSAPVQALVEEYQQKGHVVDHESYPQPVLQAIKKNFEHKKNIFEQFVTFDETDKAFIPNKEVVNSDWSLDTSGVVSDLSDKILVYQTLSPVGAAPTSTLAPPPRPTQTDDSIRRNSSPTFPNERNAEGGFRPMLRPLHSPLLNQ